MPSVLLDRLPLPSLQTYTAVSVLLFSCSIYYALQVTSEPGWAMNITETAPPVDNGQDSKIMSIDSSRMLLHKMLIKNVRTKKLYEMTYVIVEEPLCVMTLVNMVYCVMILIFKCTQKLVFGELRVIEQQHMKDKFWNFVFYKFIFIFGVMNVQDMDEVVLWCGWFSFVGAFHLLSTLCKDRFEYLSFSPTIPKWTHFRLFTLLFFILTVSLCLCTVVAVYANLNIFSFMAAEWALVIIRTLYVFARYAIYLYDAAYQYQGIWERRGVYTYYCELISDLSSLSVDLLHHVHMLIWRNIFLSVASLVICMQLRCFVNDIQRKISRHKNYLRVAKHMEDNFPLATAEEIDANSDDCAICWDRMETARKLPCSHMFHTSCLHSWLEQVTNCPTCRTSLVPKPTTANPNRLLGQDPRQQTTNHFFHFDGSRYVSWLPSFSVEVSHTSLLGQRSPVTPVRTSNLDLMVTQVLQLFPHMPYNIVLEDLLVTHSVEDTIDNILEERLTAPPTAMFPPTSSTTAPPAPAPAPAPAPSPPASFHGTSFLSLFYSENRSQRPHTPPPPPPRRSPLRFQRREPIVDEGSDSSDSGLSDNTSRPVESVIKTGGEGTRFSKNSRERENILSHRKDELIRRARNKYISRVLLPRPRSRESGIYE